MRWLEKELNERYLSPSERPFRILNFAIGGAKMPFQVNAVSQFGAIADAVVVIDGYNEAVGASSGGRIDSPPPFYGALVGNAWGGKVLLQAMRWMRIIAYESPLLRKSFFLYKLFTASMGLYVRIWSLQKRSAERVTLSPDLRRVEKRRREPPYP